jgi:hypothetical protein
VARGPLPSPNARRRNAATIPSTKLQPRKGRAPACPQAYSLKKAGRAWWNWAWKTPQASRWTQGDLYVVARRASLEDDLVALERADKFDVADLLLDLHGDDAIKAEREVGREVEFLISKLKGLAGGRVGVMKEMRELDNRLGLNPKALADLRWEIDDGTEGKAETPPPRRSTTRSKSKTKAKTKGKAKGKGKGKQSAKVAQLDDYRNRYD